ncbi:phosphotransferase system, enzyme I, PtsI [Desulfuromusa kysingii]|uniref:phosphoenolpyruvate--protein phosphotransferase n=1 Tax=Desulfuromusa kysingii TaxID=37625 RepID=A0A1H3XAR6_9BACT|nr:phosphoenolpyruvate--protein phosphotransferase [Desulfuromusa kysingii]SDZ96320.1 phosphotransferase system, enzyme I, PtsI [Desulfuromusa kysingii]
MNNSLSLLKKIVQEAASLASPSKQMVYIVSAVRAAMQVSVCSLFIADETNVLTLTATDGLDPAAVGKVKLTYGEGLVGTIARNSHPLNIEDASKHPGYRYFPETQEEQYQAFLGVPLVHLRRLVGVLVVQESQRRKFTDDEEAFLLTIAAQLAATLSLDQSHSWVDMTAQDNQSMQRVLGVKGAIGIASGVIHLLSEDSLEQVADQECKNIDAEIDKFHTALQQCQYEIDQGSLALKDSLSGDIATIFTAYKMLLESKELIDDVERGIRQGNWAQGALRAAISQYADLFGNMEDPYLRSRSEDVWNIGNKLHSKLHGRKTAVSQDQNLILAGDLISITDIARYKREQLVGILCQTGSSLSHTAVLANALGLPAVMGTGKIKNLQQGIPAILDGYQGQVILYPSQEVLSEYQKLASREKNLFTELEGLKEQPAITPDGHRVHLYANTGLMADISPGLKRGAEGIGLYRSEIPFMIHENFPTEEEQRLIYRHVLNTYEGKPVTLRTLDIGGDKALPYFHFSEENSYLGWRGIRFTLDNRPIFMTQIRAMLRASEGLDNLHILLPMVSRVDELDAFNLLLEDACTQLKLEGYQVKRPPVGIMVEVPAAVNLLPFFASRINFISIGSNDLTQYLLALDRNNSRVSHLFDNLHPAVLQEIYRIVQLCRTIHLPVSLCGEMAADPLAVILLLGMKIEALSMSAYNLSKVKWLIRTMPVKVAEETLQKALTMESEVQIRELTKGVLIKHKLGKLVH